MQRSGRGRRWLPRALALLLVAGTVALAGGPLPSPELRPASATNPVPPTNVVATGADRALAISWTAPAEAIITGYNVYVDGVVVASPTTTSVAVPELVNGRSYVVTVTTRSSFLGLPTEGSTASTPVTGIPRDTVPPAAPTGVAAARGDGQVVLSWTWNTADDDVDGYRVLRDGAPITGQLVGSAASYTDTAVTNDVTYAYTVQTRDTSGNWSVSSTPVASATPTDLMPPATPTGLMGGRGDGTAGLAWNPNGEVDLAGYVVLRDGVDVATVTDTDHLDVGLTNDTTYGYTLVAVDTHGNRSTPTAPLSITPTDLTPPSAPTGLVAVRGDGQVELAWAANPEPDLGSYRVMRDGVEVVIVTGATSYTDAGLTNDVEYRYTLAAVDTHGNNSISSSPAFATPTDLGAPAVPTGLVATRGDGQATLTWAANPDADLAGYVVIRDGAEIATVTGTSHTDTGLTNDTTYGYALVAIDTHGNRSAPSAPVTATPTDLTPPAAPTGLGVTKVSGRSVLSWTANTEPDLAGYRVFRDGVEVATVTGTTSYTDSQISGASRTYYLVAVDTHGNRSAPSTSATAAADVTPPAVPTGLTATRGDGQVTLTWAKNNEPDFAGYRVLRDGVEIATVTARTYVDAGLTNDVTYTYRLVAVDDVGNRSAASAPVSATPTDLAPPAAPTGLAAVAGENEVSLSWAANAEPDLADYRLLRDGVEIATLTTRSFLDTGLTNDVAYSYTLVAVDTHGNRSAVSPVVVATPRDSAPDPPTGLTAAPGDRRTGLTWTAPPDVDVVSYRVLSQDGTTVATATDPTTQAAVSGLVNGTTYSFTVVAVDAAGNVSPPSAAVTVVPSSPPVPAGGAGESGGLAVSEDGRYVLVGTRARLEAADTNSAYEMYLVDRTAGTAVRIAPLPAGATGATDPTNTSAPVISANGSTVALATTAALVAGDTNGRSDVYRFDVATRAWGLVSVPSDGRVSSTTAGAELQTGSSVYATSPPVVLSGDGTLALFYSARSDLVPGDTNGVVDLFAKSIPTGVVTRVSTTTAGGNLAGAATGPALALTPDGRFALFPATATGGSVQLYRKTLSGAGAGELLLVSTVRSTPFAVFRDAGDISISDDGRYVALVTAHRITTASPGQVGSAGLAYRVDTATGAVLALGNGQQTVWEHQVELDPTGRYAFFSTAAGQLAEDTNGHTDHYRRDLGGGVAGPLLLVTSDADGRATAGPIGSVTPAEYGRLVAVTADQILVTTSQALVSADTNRIRDLYAKDLVSGLVRSPLA